MALFYCHELFETKKRQLFNLSWVILNCKGWFPTIFQLLPNTFGARFCPGARWMWKPMSSCCNEESIMRMGTGDRPLFWMIDTHCSVLDEPGPSLAKIILGGSPHLPLLRKRFQHRYVRKTALKSWLYVWQITWILQDNKNWRIAGVYKSHVLRQNDDQNRAI